MPTADGLEEQRRSEVRGECLQRIGEMRVGVVEDMLPTERAQHGGVRFPPNHVDHRNAISLAEAQDHTTERAGPRR